VPRRLSRRRCYSTYTRSQWWCVSPLLQYDAIIPARCASLCCSSRPEMENCACACKAANFRLCAVAITVRRGVSVRSKVGWSRFRSGVMLSTNFRCGCGVKRKCLLVGHFCTSVTVIVSIIRRHYFRHPLHLTTTDMSNIRSRLCDRSCPSLDAAVIWPVEIFSQWDVIWPHLYIAMHQMVSAWVNEEGN